VISDYCDNIHYHDSLRLFKDSRLPDYLNSNLIQNFIENVTSYIIVIIYIYL